MVPFKLTKEQQEKLKILAEGVAPHFKVLCGYYHCSFNSGHEDVAKWYVTDTKNEQYWGWLEFCMRYAVKAAAHMYVTKHINTTHSWAEYMIAQKIAHEMETINPIDTLYDICVNPQNYAQSL